MPTLLVLAAVTFVGVLPRAGSGQRPEHPHLQGEPPQHAHVYVIDDLHPQWP